MIVRPILDNPLPNGGFKTCSDLRCLLCKHSIISDSFKSPLTGNTYKIFGNTSCRTDCIYLISCKVCSMQYRETGDLCRKINNPCSTIKTTKIMEPEREHFNMSGHKWEDMTGMVIDDSFRVCPNKIMDNNHSCHVWTDAKRIINFN